MKRKSKICDYIGLKQGVGNISMTRIENQKKILGSRFFLKKNFWRVRGKGFLQKTRYPPPGGTPVLFAL